MPTNGYFYMKSYYYKVKHQVFRDPNDLEIHHNDDDIHNGKPGLNRFIEARKWLNNGDHHDRC